MLHRDDPHQPGAAHHPLHPLRSRRIPSMVSCALCGAPVPLGTKTLEVEFQLCCCASCIGIHPGAGQPGRPSLKQAGPGKRNVVPRWGLAVPGSTSVLRSTSCLGPGGVAIFLNRSASTPPRILIGVFLIPPVRCTGIELCGIRSQLGQRPIVPTLSSTSDK